MVTLHISLDCSTIAPQVLRHKLKRKTKKKEKKEKKIKINTLAPMKSEVVWAA